MGNLGNTKTKKSAVRVRAGFIFQYKTRNSCERRVKLSSLSLKALHRSVYLGLNFIAGFVISISSPRLTLAQNQVLSES